MVDKILDISKDIINQVIERRKELRKINNRKPPILEDYIYLKSPERGYYDEFDNQYLRGESMLDINNISDDNQYCVESVMRHNSKFLVLMKDCDADNIVNSKKINKNKILTVGDVWFNGLDYVKYVYIKSGFTNVNRYLRDLLNQYKTDSFSNLRQSREGEHLILGHIVQRVIKKTDGDDVYLFKIITADSYIVVGSIPALIVDYDDLNVGDLVRFNSKLTKTSKKTQSRFMFIGNFKVMKRGKFSKFYKS